MCCSLIDYVDMHEFEVAIDYKKPIRSIRIESNAYTLKHFKTPRKPRVAN